MKIFSTSLFKLGVLVAQVSLIPPADSSEPTQTEAAGSVAKSDEQTHNWIWITPGRNGAAARESILSLRIQGSSVTGKLSSPGRDGKPADSPIIDGKVKGNDLSFAVIREANGNLLTNRYSGTITGDTLTGKIELVRNGDTQSRDWEAKSAGDRTEANAVVVIPPKPGYDEAGHKIVNETKYPTISVAESEKFLTEHPDAVILDLRPAAAYAAGHLPNARNLDVSDDATYQNVLAPLDKSKWYVVHSVVGHYRTVRALEYFEAHGFEHAVAIDGGYQAWVSAGKPTVK